MWVKSLISGLVIGLLAGFGLSYKDQKAVNSTQAMPGKHRAPDSTKWIWPDSLDAVKAAPENHQVLFENNKIRILEVTLKPYEFEKMHTHKLPSVMFGPNGDTSQYDIIYYRYGYDSLKQRYYVKKTIRQHNGGDNPSEPNIGYFMKPEEPHRIKNLSNVKIDVFRVEFKPEAKK